MILRTGAFALLFTLCLSSCSTTKPLVWMAQDVSFSNFRAFEIQPIFNATGNPINQDILSRVTAYMKKQFEVQNLQLTDASKTKNEVLIVENELLVYKTFRPTGNNSPIFGLGGSQQPSPRNAFRCTLRTRLLKKSTKQVVARIFTTTEIGIEILESNTGERVLEKSVAAVAKEIAKMMQPMEPRGFSPTILE